MRGQRGIEMRNRNMFFLEKETFEMKAITSKGAIQYWA